MEYIGTPEFDEFDLEVYKCTCGLYTAVDSDFMENRDEPLYFSCPSCDCVSELKDGSEAIPREEFWPMEGEETVECEPLPEPNI